MDKVNDYAYAKTKFNDEWYPFRAVTLSKKLKRNETLKKFFSLETVMKVVKKK